MSLRAPGRGLLPAFQQVLDGLDARHRVLRLDADAPEEIFHPLLPLAFPGHGEEMGVIGVPRALEPGAEIKERCGQDAALRQQQVDEQPAGAAVSVDEGMDRLELGMGKRGMDQRRQGVVVEEALPGVEALGQRLGRRRNIGRLRRRAAGRTDPVPDAPEFSRHGAVAAHAAHEAFMDSPDEAQGKRKSLHAREPVFHGGDAVGDLVQVVGVRRGRGAVLGGE